MVVLLPLGAIEQHGPHLPLSVDWLGAEEIARRIAPHLSRGGYRPILAPSIPYGVSTLAIGWSGTVSLSAPTLRRLVVEIVGALAEHGFRRFVLTNYQADPDHVRALGRIVSDLERGRRVQVLVAGFTPGAPANNVMSPAICCARSRRGGRRERGSVLDASQRGEVRCVVENGASRSHGWEANVCRGRSPMKTLTEREHAHGHASRKS